MTAPDRKAAEATYTTEIEPVSGITFGRKTSFVKGWRGLLLRDQQTIAHTDHFYGASAKASATRGAARLRLLHLTHYRTTGRHLDEDRRAETKALRDAREESATRRRALTADRVQLWKALSDLLSNAPPDQEEARIRAAILVGRHRQAVSEIANDPENKRGGAPEVASPPAVLVGGRRRK